MSETILQSQAKTAAAFLLQLVQGLFPGDDPAARLPVAQLRVCNVLCGGRHSMSSLSRKLGVSLSAMTQIANRLEQASLINRVAEVGDRRVKCLQLTERGEKIMRTREEARVQRMAFLLKQLSPDARQEILDALEKMVLAYSATNGQDAAARSSSATVFGG